MERTEQVNSITHLIGTALAIAGSAVLINQAALHGDLLKLLSFSVFGSMLIVLYLVSTLYHALRGQAKAFFQKLDHCAIYLLIAGTYTPFTLVALRGELGWILFGVIWLLAAIGIVQEVLWADARGPRWFSLGLYMAMGWLGVLAAVPLVNAIGTGGMAWLAAGGALYTGGVVFYVLDTRWPPAHGIWHVFVMAGSGSHFVSVLFFVG